MDSYIISYDLIAPNKDYGPLIKAIKEYGTYAKILESLWIVKSNDSSTTIRDNLKSYIDNDDRLFVAKLTGDAAWKNVLCSNAWLRENL